MFLWIGCKLPVDYEKEIRSYCLKKNESIGLNTLPFSLPQHISLKISFESAYTDQIAEYLKVFFAPQKPFSVHISGIEKMGQILWLTVEENPILQQLHESLDQQLEKRFKITQHPFDKDFQFHSTLFMDGDGEKIDKMAVILAGYPFARELMVDTIVLGTSKSGKPGSYHVIEEIKL